MTVTTPPEALLEKIRAGNRFLISSHLNPDGDAIGSELGLVKVLRSLGKGAVVWNHDPSPSVYTALSGSGSIHVGESPPAGYPEAFDLAIVLECPSLDRTGLAKAIRLLPILNVDHHLGNELYGKVNWVDTSAPAVGEMIFRVARSLNVPLDADTATTFLLALVTDTGGFRYANTTQAAFEAAAALTHEGAQPERVSEILHESYPLSARRLLGEMLGTLKIHAGGRAATAYISQEMFLKTGSSENDTEGLIDYIRSIEGVQVAALVREKADRTTKVSLRSSGVVDIERVARSHEGGGHRNAAGFSVLHNDIDKVLTEVVAELEESLEISDEQKK
jgi:phosphoesterase RecJ-like protein